MEPLLPFACPRCGMRSVAVGICPDCRLDLVRQALEPAPAPPVPSEAPPVFQAAAVFQGDAGLCGEVVRLLHRHEVEAALAGEGRGFQVLVPLDVLGRARALLSEDWERQARAQGLDPVTEGEALALEAGSLCPACGDPLLPESPSCASCGIALA